MNKRTKKFLCSLVAVIMLATVVTPTTVAHAAKSPVTKVTTQDIRSGRKLGRTITTPYGGSFYYRTTVTFAKSSKKTKIKLKYSHQIRQSKSGTIKLTVGKNTVTLCRFKSYPYKRKYNINNDIITRIYLDSVEVKTGKKWQKVNVTNDGVRKNDVYSEMKNLTLKKIPKGSQMRFTFNLRIMVPRR